MERSYEGSCHCGALGWVFHTAVDPASWVVRSCQCSFCRTHGTRNTTDPAGRVDFRCADPEAIARYRFGLETTDFLLCRRCGVYVGAVIERPEGRFATLNLNALTAPLDARPDAEPVDYDAEGREDRIARRISRWTPVTTAV